MTYKIIDTTTGKITNCSLLSMSRKLQPNTILAEYSARGVLLNSYPISGVDMQCLSAHFAPGAATYNFAVVLAVRRAADAAERAAATDPAVAAYERAADAHIDAAAVIAIAAADAKSAVYAAAAAATYATYAEVAATYPATAAARAAYAAADAAWQGACAARSTYTNRLISKSKSAEYTRQGRFILDYLRAA